jgi:hypothetical protein
MKFFTYLFSLISIFALAGLFVFKQPNGQVWLSADSFIPNTEKISEAINFSSNKLQQIFKNDLPENNSTNKVYRWKDSNGQWNYSDKAKAPIESDEVIFDPKDIIVLPAFDVPSVDSSNSKEKHDRTPSKTFISSPSKVLELYQDANNVQKLMDSRQKNMSKAIKDNI